MIINYCVKCGEKINENQNPADKPSARIVCGKCEWRKALESEAAIYHSPITTDESEPPLLVIEVKDLNSVPIVRHNGVAVTGMVVIEYLYGTKTLEVGKHEYTIEHMIKPGKDKVPLIRKLKEKLFG